MSSNAGSSSTMCKLNCFLCRGVGHFAKDCIYYDFPCVRLCDDHKMKFGVSSQDRSLGRSFLSCRSVSSCNGFLWVDEIENLEMKKQEILSNLLKKKEKEKALKEADNGEVTLKISTEQNMEMSAQGSAKAISELVKRLANVKM